MEDKIKMRPSRVLEKLRNNEIATCIKLNLADSRVVEIAAMSGVDCVWTDMEHVGNDLSVIERQILASKAYDTDIMVRVSRGGYSDYIRPLEMDATGIMVPHVMSLEDAKRVVRMTKFHPVGRRPLDGGNSDGSFCSLTIKDYIMSANSQRFVMIQIEDPEPLDELEEIIALEGIDMVLFGPGDFTQGIGDPGNFSHPLVIETRRKIPRLAQKYGKYAGTVGSAANIAELIDEGYRFISMGADVVGLGSYFKSVMNDFGKAEGNEIKSIYGR